MTVETKGELLLSPWHNGERLLQEKYGFADKMAAIGPRVIRRFMPEQHKDFFNQLPFVIAGSVDDKGDAWASIISGTPGFISSPSNTELSIFADIDQNDPISRNLVKEAGIGLLGIELHTRRRNRVNGSIKSIGTKKIELEVEHSFGNCPKYIHLRNYKFIRSTEDFSNEKVQHHNFINPELEKQIEVSDTFFVTSYINTEKGPQVDVSHRGGKPGFIKINDDGSLTIPDYAGNFFFNTLGNFLENPKAGLLFPNFENGDLIHLTGNAEVILNSPETKTFIKAERIWKFRPHQIILRPNALPIRWDLQEYSPNI